MIVPRTTSKLTPGIVAVRQRQNTTPQWSIFHNTGDEDRIAGKRNRLNKRNEKLLALVRMLAPLAMFINVTRFATIFANKMGFLPSVPTSNVFLNNILIMMQSLYPMPNIFSLTAAVCWAHILENTFIVFYRSAEEGTFIVINNPEETVGNTAELPVSRN